MPEPHALYAIHGPNDLDYDGWVIVTEGIGHDPNNHHGEDYRYLRQTPIVRLNNGYGPSQGTIPLPQYYEDFAQRVANFVAASNGCTRWIIGNEMNFAEVEAPDGVPITPALYARCFNLCRAAIKALPDHEDDQVLVGAVAPWNDQTKYPGNPLGDWIVYFEDIQHEIAGCDGFAIHFYAREQTPASVVVTTRMNPPFEDHHNGYQTYTDWMAAILIQYIGLPVYCTETNAIVPWIDEDTGFVRQAYQEIFTWNGLHPGRPILCLALYRWQYDKWRIKGKQGPIDDFYTAVECNYFYPPITDPPPEPEPPEPPQGGESMLQNPGFEMPYLEHGAGEVKVAQHWRPFWTEGDPPHEQSQGPCARPEYKPLPTSLDAHRVVEGDTAQCWFLTNNVMDGGVYQRVQVEPGEWYQFDLSAQAWCTNSGDPFVSDGEMYLALGIDVAGREDAFEVGVIWTSWEWVGPDHRRYMSRVVQAEGDHITVFARAWNKWRLRHNDMYADDAHLLRVEVCEDAPPTEPPGPEPPDPPTGECNVDYERIKLDTQEVIEQALTRRDPVVWPQ